MRIHTRLFLGTALLVLVLTAIQWLLHRRQLAAIERELGAVATAVGKGILDDEVQVLVRRPIPAEDAADLTCVGEIPAGQAAPSADPAPGPLPEAKRIERVIVHRELAPDEGASCGSAEAEGGGGPKSGEPAASSSAAPGGVEVAGAPARIELRVVAAGGPEQRYLVLSDGAGTVRRIPIPVSSTQRIVRETSRHGLVVGAGLLVVGLVAAGMLAGRLTSPLRRLAAGAQALGEGERGVRVPEDAPGEVGELQRAFNQMSERLAELELERSRWLEREHLAQLGDLSRGLAHTVRNPLNTLGLAIEELAFDRSDQADLVRTARAQIRRIDRWLRSFLALGAADAAAAEVVDLRALLQDVTLEAVQDGARLTVEVGEQPLPVRAVPSALRAAIANLVENAVEASPAGTPVEVGARRDRGEAVVEIADRGPGLPQEVRDRLYAPHVTTKLGGSGMGLFLARRLVVGMHNGTVEMTDRAGGGTVAELRLRLEDDHGAVA
jgi:signal transduction histidine kinase